MDSEFLEAAKRGDQARVWALLLLVGEQVGALRDVIMTQELDMAESLIANGAPVEHESCKEVLFGFPLHAAVYDDHPRLVARLLEAGAHPTVTNIDGTTPLHYVKSAVVARLLLDAKAGVTAGSAAPILSIACMQDADVLREIANHEEVDVNIKDPFSGLTSLHYAAMSLRLGDVEVLLATGADPCIKDNRGHTPLSRLNERLGFNFELGGHLSHRIMTLLVAAGERNWACLPTPCPGLEAALVPVWEKVPEETVDEELRQLFQHLEPAVQAWLREVLRALHHGGLDKPVRMKDLNMTLSQK